MFLIILHQTIPVKNASKTKDTKSKTKPVQENFYDAAAKTWKNIADTWKDIASSEKNPVKKAQYVTKCENAMKLYGFNNKKAKRKENEIKY